MIKSIPEQIVDEIHLIDEGYGNTRWVVVATVVDNSFWDIISITTSTGTVKRTSIIGKKEQTMSSHLKKKRIKSKKKKKREIREKKKRKPR